MKIYKKILDISSDISEYDLTNLLQSITNFGYVIVKRSKDCAGFKWLIKWINGGNQDSLTINSFNLDGNSPTINAMTSIDGAALFLPISDDLLRTYHNKPQV